MQLKAYWIGSFIFDYFKLLMSIITAMFLFGVFGLDLNDSMVPLVLLPFGLLPFTYVLSFIFTAESAASSLTVFLHILVLGILASIIFTLRVAIPDTMNDGDEMHKYFKLIPTYMIGSAMYCDRQCKELSDIRKSPYIDATETDPDKWAFENLTLDSLMMLFHLIFWTIILIFIEKGFFSFLNCKINTPIDKEAEELDKDVAEEA